MNIRLGTVVSAQGTTPGPASAITYTIKVDENGSIIQLTGIVPENRPHGSEIDIRAARPGSLVLVCYRDQRTDFLVFGEEPDYGPCPLVPGVGVVTLEDAKRLIVATEIREATNTGNEGVPGGGDQP